MKAKSPCNELELSDAEAAWDRRVCAYEALGMTRSDAQGVVQAEEMQHGPAWVYNAPLPEPPPAVCKEWIRRYATNGCNTGCPRCWGPITSGPVTLQDDQPTQEISCSGCSFSFVVVYSLRVADSGDMDGNGQTPQPAD